MASSAKILISVPTGLASRMRAAIPVRKRSRVIAHLLEKEIQRREQKLYKAALAAENDAKLNAEMKDWEITVDDGVDSDESW